MCGICSAFPPACPACTQLSLLPPRRNHESLTVTISPSCSGPNPGVATSPLSHTHCLHSCHLSLAGQPTSLPRTGHPNYPVASSLGNSSPQNPSDHIPPQLKPWMVPPPTVSQHLEQQVWSQALPNGLQGPSFRPVLVTVLLLGPVSPPIRTPAPLRLAGWACRLQSLRPRGLAHSHLWLLLPKPSRTLPPPSPHSLQ